MMVIRIGFLIYCLDGEKNTQCAAELPGNDLISKFTIT